MCGRGYAKIEEQEDGTFKVKAKPSEFIWKSPHGLEDPKIIADYMEKF